MGRQLGRRRAQARGTRLAARVASMARTRAVILCVAALSAVLCSRVVGQRVTTYQAAAWPVASSFAPPPFPQLRLAGTAPLRVSWRPSEVALAGAFTAALLIDAAAGALVAVSRAGVAIRIP